MSAEHGTASRYSQGCRCRDCTWASTAAKREYNARMRSKAVRGEVEVKHGTASGYVTYGCRCDACREFWRGYFKLRRRPVPILDSEE